MRTVQYRFARFDDGTVVDVSELPASPDRGSIVCLGCGERMVAHLKDDKVARHFAHFRRAANCAARETYLHRAAKALFIRTYRSCLSSNTAYVLSLPVKDICTELQAELGFTCEIQALCGYDLTQWYEFVEEEGTIGSFRADVLLRSSAATRRPLLVEFAVTHACEPAKVAGGGLILEISIQEESDLQKLLVPHLTATARSRITAHNFRPRSKVRALCGGNCLRQVKVMVVHASGAPKLFTVAAGKAKTFAPRSAVWKRVLTKFESAPPEVDLDQLEYVGDDLPAGGNLLERGCFAALLDGVSITNCYVCRHRGTTSFFSKVWCHQWREEVHNNHAPVCEHFARIRGAGGLRALQARNARWLQRQR